MSDATFYTRKLAERRAVLAPMAGYTDAPFRRLCREQGSAWAVTEMVSAKGLVTGNLQGIEIGAPYPGEPDLVIQVFGGEPEVVAAGGRILYDKYHPAALDLNMGCPVKKVVGKSCGSKLMLEPARAAAIVRQLNGAVPVPVSAKLRLGFDTVNVLEVAHALEEAGAALVAVHGRTAKQKYSGEANWDTIKQVADAVSIPVVGSGDVTTKEQFERYTALGLGVMIARGAVGRPWLFAELRGVAPPDAAEVGRWVYRHALLHCAWYGAATKEREAHALRSLRSQLIKYFAFLPEARPEVVRLESLAELRGFIARWLGVEVDKAIEDQLSKIEDQGALSPAQRSR